MDRMSEIGRLLPACREALQFGVGMLMQSTLLLLVGLFAARLLRRRGPAYQVCIHQTVLLAITASCLYLAAFGSQTPSLYHFALPSATRDEPSLSSSGIAAEPVRLTPTAPPTAPPAAESTLPVPAMQVQVIAPAHPRLSSTAPSYSAPFRRFLSTNSIAEPTWQGWCYLLLVSLWLCGAIGHLVWFCLCYVGMLRIRRAARPLSDPQIQATLDTVCRAQGVAPPELRTSAHIRTACLIGVLRPTILLPIAYDKEFEPDSLEGVLAHEAAHLAGRHGWWNLGLRAACAVGWVHPLLWRLLSEWEQASEEVCDQVVLALRVSPQAYARCLLQQAERMASPNLLLGHGIVTPRSSLARRIARIMGAPPAEATVTNAARLVMGATTLVLAGILATFVAVSHAQDDHTWASDVRLDQKVIVRAEGVPLRDLLPLLTKETGVRLEAEDYVADDKVILFGPVRSLREILTDIALLFNDRWAIRHPDGDPAAYRLVREQRARDYEAMLNSEMDARILAQLDMQVKALSETPEQLARRPLSDPIRQTLSSKDGRLATEIFALVPPESRQDLIDRWVTRLPVRALSPSQKAQLEPLFFGDKFVPDANGLAVTPIPREEMDKHDLTFDIIGSRLSGHIHISLRAPAGFDLPLADVETAARLPLPPHGNPYTGAKIQNVKTLHDAETVRNAGGTTWLEHLQALSEKTGRPIVADFYRSKPIHFAAGGEEKADPDPAIAALDTLCREPGYLWWTQGKTLVLRKRDWYYQRFYETPDRWILALVQQLKKHEGAITYGDVLSLLDLSTSQIVGLSESSGGVADRRLLGGLREMLGVMAAAGADRNMPLATGMTLTSPETLRTIVKPDLNDARVGPLYRKFLAEYFPDVLSNPRLDKYGMVVLPDGPKEKAATLTISTLFHSGNSVRMGYLFNIPLALPDDHRDQTEVKLVKAGA